MNLRGRVLRHAAAREHTIMPFPHARGKDQSCRDISLLVRIWFAATVGVRLSWVLRIVISAGANPADACRLENPPHGGGWAIQLS
jgi:hypothetical protein